MFLKEPLHVLTKQAVVRRKAITTVVLRLKRVRLFRELQGTCQVVVCQLSAFWHGYGMLYNRGL